MSNILAVYLAIRGILRERSGYNAMRRERINKRKLIRAFDDTERKLEALKDRAKGIERIRCINDIYWLKTQRLRHGV